jgi:hypothetical protein
MQGNALVGFVPSEIGSFLKRLTLLDLSRNLLTGAIPENLADLPKLKELYLHNNQFIGGNAGQVGRPERHRVREVRGRSEREIRVESCATELRKRFTSL